MYMRSDKGPEFVSNAVLRWLKVTGIETALIDPPGGHPNSPTCGHPKLPHLSTDSRG
jgi:putative transposase